MRTHRNQDAVERFGFTDPERGLGPAKIRRCDKLQPPGHTRILPIGTVLQKPQRQNFCSKQKQATFPGYKLTSFTCHLLHVSHGAHYWRPPYLYPCHCPRQGYVPHSPNPKSTSIISCPTYLMLHDKPTLNLLHDNSEPTLFRLKTYPIWADF